jgi:hypothetical protein
MGQSHQKENKPCQDAFAYKIIGNSGIIAISDGLGSAEKSDIGSKTIVIAAIDTWINGQKNYEKENLVNSDFIIEIANESRNNLIKKMNELNCDIRDLACTLIIIVFYEGYVGIGHIGDGAVIGCISNQFKILSQPEPMEYTTDVWPITDDLWKEHFRIVDNFNDVSFLIGFTDDCQSSMLSKTVDGWFVSEELAEKLLVYLKELDELSYVQSDLVYLLTSTRMTENRDDDKTLVLALL